MKKILLKMKELMIILKEMLNDKFVSETNTNTYEYATNALDNYCYVPSKYTLWHGRYIRYLDTSSPFEIKLKLGGFMVSDNGYTVEFRRDKKTFRIDRRNKLFFMIMTQADLDRIHINNLIV